MIPLKLMLSKEQQTLQTFAQKSSYPKHSKKTYQTVNRLELDEIVQTKTNFKRD